MEKDLATIVAINPVGGSSALDDVSAVIVAVCLNYFDGTTEILPALKSRAVKLSVGDKLKVQRAGWYAQAPAWTREGSGQIIELLDWEVGVPYINLPLASSSKHPQS